MSPVACITTSWDDGHPVDLRVAELLVKHGLNGTFYIPQTADNETMLVTEIRELMVAFEVGAHTLKHVVLTGATEKQAWHEIADSKSWIEDNTGRPCLMFCPPLGKYAGRHLEMVRKAGYLGVRSVEMMSLDFPRQKSGLLVVPTTVQAYPHPFLSLGRNAIRRAAFENLWRCVVHGRSTDWPALARSLMYRAIKCGGVFHLWGHSWELQQTGQWQQLEDILRFMSEFTSQASPLTNGEICQVQLFRDVSSAK